MPALIFRVHFSCAARKRKTIENFENAISCLNWALVERHRFFRCISFWNLCKCRTVDMAIARARARRREIKAKREVAWNCIYSEDDLHQNLSAVCDPDRNILLLHLQLQLLFSVCNIRSHSSVTVNASRECETMYRRSWARSLSASLQRTKQMMSKSVNMWPKFKT